MGFIFYIYICTEIWAYLMDGTQPPDKRVHYRSCTIWYFLFANPWCALQKSADKLCFDLLSLIYSKINQTSGKWRKLKCVLGTIKMVIYSSSSWQCVMAHRNAVTLWATGFLASYVFFALTIPLILMSAMLVKQFKKSKLLAWKLKLLIVSKKSIHAVYHKPTKE
jgi:hypothetical protein